ncbi:hypothetical protein Vretifemale_17050 [Volvox reticuliferus]|nr:hypothetical protein Vretifemale_17050 [Volvox reticuliferus]
MGKDKLADPLDLKNYATWSYRFEMMLEGLRLHRWLLEDPMTDEDMEASDRVKAIMVKNVKDHHLPIIRTAANARVAWDCLAAIFAATRDARRSQLVKELSTLKMKQGEALPVYLARTRGLFWDLTQVGHPVAEREIVYNMLIGLPEKFSAAVTCMTISGQALTLNGAGAQLLAYEKRVDAEEVVRRARNGAGGAGNSRGGGGGPPLQGVPGRHRNGRSGQQQCWTCGEFGHVARQCQIPWMPQGTSYAPRPREWPDGAQYRRDYWGGYQGAAGGSGATGSADHRGASSQGSSGSRRTGQPKNFACRPTRSETEQHVTGFDRAHQMSQIEELWHRRYGHIGMERLEWLVKCNLVAGIDLSQRAGRSGVCEPCVMSKQTRSPHQPTGHRSVHA